MKLNYKNRSFLLLLLFSFTFAHSMSSVINKHKEQKVTIKDFKGDSIDVPLEIVNSCQSLKSHLDDYVSDELVVDLSHTLFEVNKIKILFKAIKEETRLSDLKNYDDDTIKALYEIQRYCGAPSVLSFNIQYSYRKRFKDTIATCQKDELYTTARLILEHKSQDDESVLDLSGIKLDNVCFLGYLESFQIQKVKILNISDNRLTSLDLTLLWNTFPNLQIVFANNNKIKQVKGVAPKETVIELRNNPLGGEKREPVWEKKFAVFKNNRKFRGFLCYIVATSLLNSSLLAGVVSSIYITCILRNFGGLFLIVPSFATGFYMGSITRSFVDTKIRTYKPNCYLITKN